MAGGIEGGPLAKGPPDVGSGALNLTEPASETGGLLGGNNFPNEALRASTADGGPDPVVPASYVPAVAEDPGVGTPPNGPNGVDIFILEDASSLFNARISSLS